MTTPIGAYAKAIEAYQRAGQGSSVDPAEDGAGGGFAAMVKAAMSESVSASQASEAMTAQALQGNADLSQVVTATAEAEVALQSAVAVRDRIIEAYKDVMRMSI